MRFFWKHGSRHIMHQPGCDTTYAMVVLERKTYDERRGGYLGSESEALSCAQQPRQSWPLAKCPSESNEPSAAPALVIAETRQHLLPGLESSGAGPSYVANKLMAATVHGPAVEAMDKRSGCMCSVRAVRPVLASGSLVCACSQLYRILLRLLFVAKYPEV